jgi:hypothetical protein
MSFVSSFALAIAFNFLLIIRGWYCYRITKERIPFPKYLKKLFLVDMEALFALINVKFIKGKSVYNLITIISIFSLLFLFIAF